jgi:hypothetical protein
MVGSKSTEHADKQSVPARSISISVLRIRIRDPESGALLFWLLDPGSGMEKIQIQDPGSGINIPDVIFENLVPYQFVQTLLG